MMIGVNHFGRSAIHISKIKIRCEYHLFFLVALCASIHKSWKDLKTQGHKNENPVYQDKFLLHLTFSTYLDAILGLIFH